MPDSGYWSLLAVTPQVPSPPLCRFFWKILQSESVNRIRNIYSQVEKQSQVKLQGVPKNLISMSRTKRNLKRAPEMDSSLSGVGEGKEPDPSCKGDGPGVIHAV